VSRFADAKATARPGDGSAPHTRARGIARDVERSRALRSSDRRTRDARRFSTSDRTPRVERASTSTRRADRNRVAAVDRIRSRRVTNPARDGVERRAVERRAVARDGDDDDRWMRF